ncbi:MAG: AAA family ATPase [Bdellovibrionota bacterium]
MTPLFWDTVVGHQAPLSQLRRLIDRRSAPHALIFSGPPAVGKRTVARAFAAALLTDGGSDAKTEEKLRLIGSGNHPDLHWVTKEPGKKDIPVETVRSMCSAIRLKPYYSASSVVILDNAHEMSLAASNSLLMTLEEPTQNSYLILVTHAPQRLPATILSRCQSVHFGELSPKELTEILARVLPQDLDKKAAHALVELCTGCLEALELDAFVNPTTLRVDDTSDLRAHLTTLVDRTVRLKRTIDNILSSDSVSAQSAVTLASTLSAEADDLPLGWRLLNQKLRTELRRAAPGRRSYWAGLLELSLDAEKLTFERNANAQLQLTTLLLHGTDDR